MSPHTEKISSCVKVLDQTGVSSRKISFSEVAESVRFERSPRRQCSFLAT